jgi:L-cysteine S-thiosulfotransferase
MRRFFNVLCLSALTCTNATATDTRKSGFEFMLPATQALQNDDAQNPAMLWVKDGEAAWAEATGNAKKSCASCHGDATKTMRGVAARYPAFSSALKRPVNLAQQINFCRTTNQQAAALPVEDQTLLGIEAYIALQSRGLPVAPPKDRRLNAAHKQGEALFQKRIGQIDLSCKDCHVDLAGKSLAGNKIPQAHPTGYPIYRLEWQSVGSLQRRLRNCMVGVRAEPFAAGGGEMIALELYLASRARGMLIESPAVRP